MVERFNLAMEIQKWEEKYEEKEAYFSLNLTFLFVYFFIICLFIF